MASFPGKIPARIAEVRAPTHSKRTALRCRGLSKQFIAGQRRITALDAIDLDVGAGRICGLIGPDGAGKTTLLRLAAGLLSPDAGSIEVLGRDVGAETIAVQELIGYMPQRFGLYEDLTVGENLELYADLQGVPVAERTSRYRELMQMTGLDSFTSRLAGRLSGGMKQKLGLACTLVRAPPLLLLDEPTVGVDPVSRRELWGIVRRAVEKQGASVLLSTAYLDEAERCDEVVIMHEGRMLGAGDPASFSEPMRGRSFMVHAPAVGKRRLQAALATAPGVVDALIHDDDVRVVMDRTEIPNARQLWPDGPELIIEAVPPSIEDAFVSKLKSSDGMSKARSPGTQHSPVRGGDEDVIVVRNAQRRFGEFQAVKGISFTVKRGEVFGLLGANGAGKSTTFRMLCGLLPASGGELRVAGHDLRRAAARARARIGYMAQRFSLYSNLSVLQNLQFFASSYGLRGDYRRERIEWALDSFELASHADSAPRDLPLGYQQRLALSAALMHEPEILFLDEPTSGVDPLARRVFWQRINALAEAGFTVLVTTHFMDEANYCDRLVIMAEGEILAEDTPEALRARFRSTERPSPSMEDAFIRLIESREGMKAA
jgi:ABC-2 type transport system ATP-binding protein